MSQLEAMYRTATVQGADGRLRPFHSGVTLAQARSLTALVEAERPRATLEVGFAFGASALAILSGLKAAGNAHAQHRVVDPYQHSNWAGTGMAVVTREGYEVELIEQPSHAALVDLARSGERFDFVFIDGGHTHEVVVVDAMLTDSVLTVGGIVVFHDYALPAVHRGVKYLVDSGRYERVREAELPVLPIARMRRGWQRLKTERLKTERLKVGRNSGSRLQPASALVNTDMPVLRKHAHALSDA